MSVVPASVLAWIKSPNQNAHGRTIS
jgi:hypothetical protein